MNSITTGRHAVLRSLSCGALAIALIGLPLTAGISASADDSMPVAESTVVETSPTEPALETAVVEPQAESPDPATAAPESAEPVALPDAPEPADPALEAGEGPDAVNEVPEAQDDFYTMVQGTTLLVDAPGVLANDTDPENDPLTVFGWIGFDPAELVAFQTGEFAFTPDPSFTGVTTFQYRAAAGTGISYPRTVTITVTASTNPIANPDFYTTPMNTPLVVSAPGVLANDSYPIGKVINHDDITGEIVLNAEGSLTYTPPTGFVGTKTFSYQMSDYALVSNWALITITVTGSGEPNQGPEAPIGTPDAYSTPMNTVLTVPANGVLANDNGALAVVDLTGQPAGLEANFDGSFTYTPPTGFIGDVSFSYRMSVGSDMLSDWIPVTISVTPIATPVPPLTTTSSSLASTGAVGTGALIPALALLVLGTCALWLSTRRRHQTAL